MVFDFAPVGQNEPADEGGPKADHELAEDGEDPREDVHEREAGDVAKHQLEGLPGGGAEADAANGHLPLETVGT